jgi:para-aminobenzoate synthetase
VQVIRRPAAEPGSRRVRRVESRVVVHRRVLLIDNVDSFTFNVADLLHRVLGEAPTVWRNTHAATAEDLQGFAAIVVGPGPGRPQVPGDMGLSDLALRQRQVPVLGVCLGHQGMAHLAGDAVVQMEVPRHGIVSPVQHDGTGIFAGVPSPFEVVRYHSLDVRLDDRSPLAPVAWALDDGCLMALADPAQRRWGVQFHPESVLSQHGDLIVANFLRLAGVECATEPTPGPVAVGDAPRPHPVAAGRAREVTLEVCRAAGPVDPWLLHEQLTADSEVSCWLDASDGRGVSVVALADGPLAVTVTHRVGTGSQVTGADPEVGSAARPLLLDTLDALLGRYRLVDRDLPFDVRPGLVGYLGYELKAETSGVAAHASALPDAWLVLSDRMVVLDHATGEVHALALVDAEVAPQQRAWLRHVEALVAQLRGRTDTPADTPDPAAASPDVRGLARHSEAAYLALVAACRRQIAAGESYEICLTNEVSWPHPVDPAALHRTLRRLSPVPCGTFLRLPGLAVVGASPERFVSVSAAGVVEARPIKGTRPRDPDPARDAALVDDLAAHVKDRAENLMIVDLLRHDLHRVCRSGSVHVPSLFQVESYATVHQLVSTVRGELAEGMVATDVLRSCFPGGSMTGAPKVRTMEILDALEGAPRGVYSGAVGWLGLNGAMDTSIVIRTATVVEGHATFGVGGAVTALSDPQEEYAETLTKARAMATALAVSALSPPGRDRPR